MARPTKPGVDYFPKDTGFYTDDKVRLLRVEFGAKGMYLLDYLMCDIYGKDGYFVKWDKNKCFLVSDGAGCGCSPEFITEFLDGCIRCSFFNERVFKAFGVLTSAGIQRRYIRMLNSREEIHIIEEYWLLDISNKRDVPGSISDKIILKKIQTNGNPVKSTENPVKSTVNPQSKVKESKVKESKVNKVPDEIKNAWEEYIEMRKKIKKPMTEKAAQLALKKLENLTSDREEQKLILEQSIFNSWQGLFPLKDKKAGGEKNDWQNFKPSR